MKKLILLTTLLASTALAQDTKLYLKANINATHFNTIVDILSSLKEGDS